MNHDLYIKWIPPPTNWLKLNLDGAVSVLARLAGCGGVLRDHNGNFLGAFSAFLGDCSIMTAELRAILFGVKLAIQKKIANLIIESDSSSAICFIKLGCPKSHLCFSLVEEIRNLAGVIPEVVWSHAWREGNLLADSFAKHALSCQVPLVSFDSVPSFASIAFYTDKSAFSTAVSEAPDPCENRCGGGGRRLWNGFGVDDIFEGEGCGECWI
ncbi:Ribonuclease H domain [Sesbania bispinosa]|nr:Ribonuclease H domain [Sesbania bispinosa]